MKSRFVVITAILLLGLSLGYLYGNLVVTRSPGKFNEYKETVYLKSNIASVNFNPSAEIPPAMAGGDECGTALGGSPTNKQSAELWGISLPREKGAPDFSPGGSTLIPQAYLLKIKHVIRDNQSKKIFVNGTKLNPDKYFHVKRKGIMETDYMHLPKEIIKKGGNSIDVVFSENRPADIDVILSNYRKQVSGGIFVLFHDSTRTSFRRICLTTLFIAALFFLLSAVAACFLNKIFSLGIDRFFIYQIYYLLPFIVCLTLLLIGCNLSRLYKIVITPGYFCGFGLINFVLVAGYQIAGKIREFCDKCIILFLTLFVACALLLTLHLESIAEPIANVAFFALLAGAVTKFVRFLRWI